VATPKDNFEAWVVNGCRYTGIQDEYSDGNTFYLAIDKPLTVKAVFKNVGQDGVDVAPPGQPRERGHYLELTLEGSGTLTVTGDDGKTHTFDSDTMLKYRHGTVLNLAAEPAGGFRFKAWSIGGKPVRQRNFDLDIDTTMTVTAIFEPEVEQTSVQGASVVASGGEADQAKPWLTTFKDISGIGDIWGERLWNINVQSLQTLAASTPEDLARRLRADELTAIQRRGFDPAGWIAQASALSSPNQP
jgi:hypothetical protein